MNQQHKDLLDACQAADRDWSEIGEVSCETMLMIRAVLWQEKTIAEKSLLLVEKMRKTLDDAKVGDA